jgi:hypothetical protein
MARSTFGGTTNDILLGEAPDGALHYTTGTLTFWTASTGGTQHVDLLMPPGGSAASSIPVGANGQMPAFEGPDGVTEMWVDAGGDAGRFLLLDRDAGGGGGGGGWAAVDASETVKGIAELATQAETNTGTDDARIVTPLKLQTRMAAYAQPLDSDLTAIAALSTTSYGRALLALADQAALMALLLSATTSAQGIVELATTGEATTGTDTTRAVTPAGLAAAIAAAGGGGGATTLDGLSDVVVASHAAGRILQADGTNFVDVDGSTIFQPLDSDLTAIAALTTTSYGRAFLALANQAALMGLLSSSSTTAQGIVELATSAETTTGTDTARAVTPAGVQAVRDLLQPLDTDLTAIAALTSAANKLPYATGAGTWTLADLTAAGRALLDDADASAQLTTLGISTFVKTILDDVDAAAVRATIGAQASDAELSALAGLTSAADKLPYFTGSGTASLADLTAAARSLLDDTTVAAMLTTLGAAPALARQTSVSSSTPTPAAGAERTFFTITAQAAAAAFANPSGTPGGEGDSMTIRIKDNGTARALTFPGTQYRDAGPGFPTTTVVGKTMYLGFLWNAADSKWDLVSKTSTP